MIRQVREWAQRHSAERRYSPIGMVFHWVMAALITFQLYWGWHMGRLPVSGEKLRAFEVHAELGLLMLVLAGLRLIWRMIVPGPLNDADRLGWQTAAAVVTHILFYLCFFGLPLSGWLMWSALGNGVPLSIAGVLPWPQMPVATLPTSIQWQMLDWAQDTHLLLVILLIVMIPLHVGAALKHHFWDKHDVLRGMLPELIADEPLEEPRHGLPPRTPPGARAGG